uniref:Glycosyl transferase, group 1 n=1 Tax=Dechloromonas aromatica (strain RCB) TaxID=159087 RepID=Q47GL5_DECAR
MSKLNQMPFCAIPSAVPKNAIHIGIDASNIRQGGGITHLSQLLDSVAGSNGMVRITVWASRGTLNRLPDAPWLEKRTHRWLEANLLLRALWQQFVLPIELIDANCDVLFAPGGILPLRVGVPTVAMSQNLTPFEPGEAARFGVVSFMRLKMWLLKQLQSRSFRRASGIVFLTRYARDIVCRAARVKQCPIAVIPHGVEERFFEQPRRARPLEECSEGAPFNLLYVSNLMPYKHQEKVADAIARLRRQGLPVAIDFVGPEVMGNGAAFARYLRQLDPAGQFLSWRGEVPFDELHQAYKQADAFIFASSCENLPNILIEAMAAGLPVLCSNRGPMPEVLGEAGEYFDPLSPDSNVNAIEHLLKDHDARSRLARLAFVRAHDYSWCRCADETLGFIREVVKESRR